VEEGTVEPRAGRDREELLRHDLVRVDIVPPQRDDQTAMLTKSVHTILTP